MSLWGKDVERAAHKFERWLEEDEELFPVYTCRMVVSVVRTSIRKGGVKTLEIEYVKGERRFLLTLIHERATVALETMMKEYAPGDEDMAGVYWEVSSKTEFVAFGGMPDIKTAVKYIDSVYTK